MLLAAFLQAQAPAPSGLEVPAWAIFAVIGAMASTIAVLFKLYRTAQNRIVELLRAKVRLRQERWEEAALGFEKAVAIALKHPEDYDEEFIVNLRRDAEHARAHAQGRDSKPDPSSPNPPSHLHPH
jgi:hypothetical protein